MNDYKQLKVWQLAFSLSTEIYEMTRLGLLLEEKHEEGFSLLEEIRACTHIMEDAIVTGVNSKNARRFLSYLKIANSASIELDTKLRIAWDLGDLHASSIYNTLHKIEVFQKLLILLMRPLQDAIEEYDGRND